MKCTVCVIDWSDACVRVRAEDAFAKAMELGTPLTSQATSIGCMFMRETERGKEMVIVQSFSEGAPSDFIVLPGTWVVKITPLTAPSDEQKNLEKQVSEYLKTFPALKRGKK